MDRFGAEPLMAKCAIEQKARDKKRLVQLLGYVWEANLMLPTPVLSGRVLSVKDNKLSMGF